VPPVANALPNTLGDCINRCQGLMGDPTGRWVTRAYALPFIQTAYSSMAKKIKMASGKNLEAIIEVLNIPAGTQSLYPFQTYGNPTGNPPVPVGPLVGLFDPLRMWVKSAGQLPGYYCPAIGPRDTLPHVNPPGITPGTYGTRVTFAWIGNRLSMTPVAGPIDLQLYGRFNAPRLQQDSDVLVLYDDMTDTLAMAACAMFGVERANPALMEGYGANANADIDNIVANIIVQGQKNPRRLAKMGGGGGGGWGWGGGGV
jgi:hypothetical protein